MARMCWEKIGSHYYCNEDRENCAFLCVDVKEKCARMLAFVRYMDGKKILNVID